MPEGQDDHSGAHVELRELTRDASKEHQGIRRVAVVRKVVLRNPDTVQTTPGRCLDLTERGGVAAGGLQGRLD